MEEKIEIKNKLNKVLIVGRQEEEGNYPPLLELQQRSGHKIVEYRTFFFDTDDDFRKWVNQLYKKFGGVTDYIILLAHKIYQIHSEKVVNNCIDGLNISLEKPYCHLIDVYNMKEKEVWERIEDLVDKGYLEYGVNIRYAWLTEKGEAYLKELSK